MKETALTKLDQAIDEMEKELARAGKICKYCRYYGRNLEHPGFCPMIRKVPLMPNFKQCSWFDYRDTKELIEIMRTEESEREKIEKAEKALKESDAKAAAKKAKKEKEEISDPEINDVPDEKEDIQKFIQEASVKNE